MPKIDVLDEITIDAPAQLIYDTVADYNRVHDWFPSMTCTVLDGDKIEEGSEVEHILRFRNKVASSLIRRIDKLNPYSSIEESYVAGDLVGTGTWSFNESDGSTRVGYHCKVRSNNFKNHISLAIAGKAGHSMVYQKLFKALKQKCEQN
jgi:uncharacterized protein YndB with AHSA1/START domain